MYKEDRAIAKPKSLLFWVRCFSQKSYLICERCRGITNKGVENLSKELDGLVGLKVLSLDFHA